MLNCEASTLTAEETAEQARAIAARGAVTAAASSQTSPSQGTTAVVFPTGLRRAQSGFLG